jgi:hypothetical protein
MEDRGEKKSRGPRKPSLRALIMQAEKAGKNVASITTPDGVMLRFGEPRPPSRATRGSPISTTRTSDQVMNRRKLPKYVQGWVDQNGRAHCYLRRRGFPRVRLPGLPWSPSFMAAYEAALAGPRAAIGAGRIKPGSVAAVVAAYFDSQQAFASKSAGTQRMRRGILQRFRNTYGDRPFALLPPEWIEALLDEKPPHAARSWLVTLRSLCQFALKRGSARRPDRKYQAAIGQERRTPLLGRAGDRAVRSTPSDRDKPEARVRAVAPHGATAL